MTITHQQSIATSTQGGYRDESLKASLFGMIADSGLRGVTIHEFREAVAERHHGSLSGSLSFMQSEGALSRLADKRGGCEPYVLPEFVAGRETVEPRTRRDDERGRKVLEIVTRYMQPAESLHGLGTDQVQLDRQHKRMAQEIKAVMLS